MSISNRIMRIPKRNVRESYEYNLGHDDARHDASVLVMHHEAAFARLTIALGELLVDYREVADDFSGADKEDAQYLIKKAEAALIMANELDEHQKTEGVE